MLTFLAGVNLLSRYQQLDPKHELYAAHEVIYTDFKVSVDVMSVEDRESMEKLAGWHWDEDHECWACFT